MRNLCIGLSVSVNLMIGVAMAAERAPQPDLIIHGGKIVTVDGAFSIAQAAAISGGKFVRVGKDAEVLALAGPNTTHVDLRGRTVLPAFTDTHNHQVSWARNEVLALNLYGVKSVADIQARIAARVRDVKPGEGIRGKRDWWEYDLKENRIPTRAELDAVAPNNPVGLSGPHYTFVNSIALKMAGITRETPSPAAGEIRKDANGDPTGVLMGRAGMLVGKLFATQPTHEQIKANLIKTMQVHNSHGLLNIREQGGSPADEALYREVFDEGKLTTRVEMCLNVDTYASDEQIEKEIVGLGTPGRKFGDGMFLADCISETTLDGAEQAAFLRQDYPGKPGYRGFQAIPVEKFKFVALTAAKNGWRMSPHAVGDAAVDQALDAFEYVNQTVPIADKRWTIDHAFLLRPDHYPRVKKLGVIINSQYMHNYHLGALILKAWKRPMADDSEAYKDWIANGIMLTNGSDGPGAYRAEPILQIYGSVTRKTGWGGSLGPSQGISREDAIRSVTINAAHTSFEEKVKGSIEVGKYADFVVLSDDILSIPADNIKDVRVLATALAGKPVHGTFQFTSN
jgi:predicted amidohydrolase YtcJ